MPHKPLKPCVDCGTLTDKTRCKTHRRTQDTQRGTSTQRGYDHKWRKVRAAHLRKEPLCRQCDRPTMATEVDHIIPHKGQSDPLFWDDSNLASLCTTHHSRKTRRENK